MHPYLTGRELTGRAEASRFVIDLDADDLVSAETSAPKLVAYLRDAVLPDRKRAADVEAEKNRKALLANPNARVNWHDRNFLDRWWQLGYRRPDLVEALSKLDRYIALSRVAVQTRQSVYAFVSSEIRPSDALQVFAFDDDYSLGVLHSTYHRQYFEERSSKMRVDPRYTSKAVFESFPWPQAPSDEAVEAVANAAAAVVELQHDSLAQNLTLARLYDSLRDPGRNPLRDAQDQLDEAVAAAYGFSPDDDILAQLLALNQSIAEEEAHGQTLPRRPGNEGLAGTKRTTSRIEPPVRLVPVATP
jgi:hypothetical protein